MESEIRRLILQDPAYADEHGLSIAHFACRRSQDEKQQQYMMLSKSWGKKSKTIIDTKPLALQPHEKHQLGKFGDKFGYNPEDIVMRTQRRKHASESLPGAVIYRETGELEIRAPVVFAWKITLWASGIALVVYYGVGIIATNTEFSTLFQEYFFWIAIIWSLSSSALLGWLVHVLSGSKRDVLGAFLSALALWLVVIQVCFLALAVMHVLQINMLQFTDQLWWDGRLDRHTCCRTKGGICAFHVGWYVAIVDFRPWNLPDVR